MPDEIKVAKGTLAGWAEALLYGDVEDEEKVITEIWNLAGLDPSERWK